MRIYETLDSIPDDAFRLGTAVAIGKFDGVHRGHRALLERVMRFAQSSAVEPVVFTFANNPLSILRPESCPAPLMSREQRLDALAAEGLSACVMVPFDAELASVPADEFVEQVLVDTMRVQHLCVGQDFRFGSGGLGDADLLVEMGRRLGFTVDVMNNIEDAQAGRVSSSRVREAIVQGDVASARRMLGRPVTMRGQVVRGDARGREIGFPTANLGGKIEGLRPADGVYAGWAEIEGVRYEAAISVGANITFDPQGEPRVEAFLLDFTGDLYGKTIEVQFAERLRGMVAFASVEALVARMKEDVRETRALLCGKIDEGRTA